MLSKIISFSGLKASGKDTSADMLQYLLSTPKILHYYWIYKLIRDFVPPKWSKVSFADTLKMSLSVLLDIPVEKFEDRDFKENYYIYFPTLKITNNPPPELTLSDKKFNRLLANKDWESIRNYYLTIRQVLQMWGTEIIRYHLGDRFWIIRTLRGDDNFIISDLRFITEFETVKHKGGLVYYIDRKGTPGNHPSEQECLALLEMNKYDGIIDNTKTLKDLFNTLKNNILWQVMK